MATDPEQVIREGMRALEETVRFSALLGLSTLDASTAGPLRGVSAEDLARPSLGTWQTVMTSLAHYGEQGSAFSSLCRAVQPDKKSTERIQSLIKLRNDIEHGGYEATEDDRVTLDKFLVDAAHRICTAWPWHIEVASSMTYDGTTFVVKTLRFAGLGRPVHSAVRCDRPIATGTVVLVGSTSPGSTSPATALTPWFKHDQNSVLLFDGVRHPRRGHFDPSASLLLFADPVHRKRRVEAQDRDGANWGQVDAWVAAQ